MPVRTIGYSLNLGNHTAIGSSLKDTLASQLKIYRLRHHEGTASLFRVTLIACGVVSLTAVSAVTLLLVRLLLLRGMTKEGKRNATLEAGDQDREDVIVCD